MGFIRFLLACGVVLCHTALILGYSPLSGDLAVQCFYIISGFYMSLILNEKYLQGSNKLFYTNRALKIYPIYWINLILLLTWGIFVNRLHYPGTISLYLTYWPLPVTTLIYFLLTNILILGLDSYFFFGFKSGWLYPLGDFNSSPERVYNFAFNSIAWTVGVELLFYVFAPFILRRNVKWLVLLMLFSITLRIVLNNSGYKTSNWNYMFFPTQLMFFMAGGIAYHLYKWLNNKPEFYKYAAVQYSLLVFVVLFFYQIPDFYIKQWVLFTLVTLLLPVSFLFSKQNKLDRYLGNLSYPIYISQALMIKITGVKFFPKILGQGFTTLIILIIFSIALEYLVSNPIERYRQKRARSLLIITT